MEEMEKRKKTVKDVTYSPKFSHFEIRGEGGLEGENNYTTFPQMLLLIQIDKVFTCLFSSPISPQVRVWSHFLSIHLGILFLSFIWIQDVYVDIYIYI